MDIITIKNVSGLVDGTFPFEWRTFSTAEWSWIKKISGYLPNTIRDGIIGDDPELTVAFAVIALVRAGKIGKQQALTFGQLLWEAEGDDVEITLTGGPQEADADPPQVPPSESSSNGSSGISGSESVTSSESPGTTQSPIGHSGLVSVPTYDPATSAT